MNGVQVQAQHVQRRVPWYWLAMHAQTATAAIMALLSLLQPTYARELSCVA